MRAENEEQTLSLRERNKRDKLLRIRTAAKELFSKKGFDATTTRQIANRAEVGLATLFLYACDKRDLLFLAYNDDLEALTTEAFRDTQLDSPLLERLVVCLRYFFIYYAKNPQVSRDLLRELTFYTGGFQSERFQKNRRRNIKLLAQMIEEAKASGEVAENEDSLLVAETIFYIFASNLRKWLAEDTLSPESGVQNLAAHLRLLVRGLDRS